MSVFYDSGDYSKFDRVKVEAVVTLSVPSFVVTSGPLDSPSMRKQLIERAIETLRFAGDLCIDRIEWWIGKEE